MQISIDYYNIDGIAVAEVAPAGSKGQPLPLAIFYHGWTSNKEESIGLGIEIAKRGYRCVMPDTIYHGERQPKDHQFENLQFVECLQTNLEEYPKIVEYFSQKDLIQDDFIGVCGISMGGITTSMLLTQNDNISVAGSLMGSPELLKLARHLIREFLLTDKDVETSELEEDQILEMLRLYQKFHQADLSMHPEVLDGVPMLFWHGEADDFVHYDFTKEFVKTMAEKEKGEKVYFISDPERGHEVSYEASVYLAAFFKAALETTDSKEIWQLTKQMVGELNYVHGNVVDHQLDSELEGMASKDQNKIHGLS